MPVESNEDLQTDVEGKPKRRRPETKLNSLADEKTQMKTLFDAQEKFTINLRQNPGNYPQLPTWVGQINGYGFQIKRNKPVKVCESLYLHLITCGEVQPLRESDEYLLPVVSVYPIDTHGTITEQITAGLINTTSSVY